MGSDSGSPVEKTILGLQENMVHELLLGEEVAMTIHVSSDKVQVHFNENVLELRRVKQEDGRDREETLRNPGDE